MSRHTCIVREESTFECNPNPIGCEYSKSPFEQFKLPAHRVLENCWEHVMDKEDRTRVLKFLMTETPRLWWNSSISMEGVVLWRLMLMHGVHDFYITVLKLGGLNGQTLSLCSWKVCCFGIYCFVVFYSMQ